MVYQARNSIYHYKTCSKCGTRRASYKTDNNSRISILMDSENLCYSCAYWTDIIEFPPDHLEIIGNIAYQVFPESNRKDKSLLLGRKGKIGYILRNDGSLMKTNDVWTLGTIPPSFQEQLKPTACWINSKLYNKLSKNKSQCNAIGCFDRYHCIRYDYTQEFADGPYNAIPSDWITGEEHCKYFINILEIPEYNNYFNINDINDESNEITKT